jgi:oxygen-dependent protoporphyrinogen oxidase
VPAHVASRLLEPLDARMAELTRMDASSAVVVALAFDTGFDLPPGFGFLVPTGERSELLACTFVDQKFPGRVPPGGRLLRAFFGGATARSMEPQSEEQIAALALEELQAILGKLPQPSFSVVRRWPRSLPQYEVGHLERMAELFTLAERYPGLHLLGNAYRGVGLPDLIRDARATTDKISG